MSKPVLSKNTKAVCGAGFGFITGWTDVVCLIRFSAFGTMMTGNLLMIARSLVEETEPLIAGQFEGDRRAEQLPTPLFFLLVISFRCLGLFLHHFTASHRFGASAILGPMIIVAMVASELMIYYERTPFPERWNVWLVAMIFGVQSAVTFASIGVPTILATGHMTSIFYTSMGAFFGEPDADMSKIVIPSAIVAAMLFGACSGAFAIEQVRGNKLEAFLLTPIVFFQVCLMWYVEYQTRPKTEEGLAADVIDTNMNKRASFCGRFEAPPVVANTSDDGKQGTLLLSVEEGRPKQ